MCDCSFVREDSLRSHVRHHQDLIPSTGGALTIVELQREHHPNEQSIEKDKQTEEVVDERTEPQELELEVETSGKASTKAPNNMVEVESHLYRRLMHNSVSIESSADHSYNRSLRPSVGQSKRGRPQKKAVTVREAEDPNEPLRLVATQTESGQVVYQLPQSMRLFSYVPIGQTNNGDTLLVINSEAIAPNSDSVITADNCH